MNPQIAQIVKKDDPQISPIAQIEKGVPGAVGAGFKPALCSKQRPDGEGGFETRPYGIWVAVLSVPVRVRLHVPGRSMSKLTGGPSYSGCGSSRRARSARARMSSGLNLTFVALS